MKERQGDKRPKVSDEAKVYVQSPLSKNGWIVTSGHRFRTTEAGALEVFDEDGALILALAPSSWTSVLYAWEDEEHGVFLEGIMSWPDEA
jgi:hypothetical protein